MAKTPAFVKEFIPYSTIKQNELKWSTYAAAKITENKVLISREFGLDFDKVYTTFLRNYRKHEKDFPLFILERGQETTKKDYENIEKYVLFLWKYYVVDRPKTVKKSKAPTVTKVKKPKVEESYDEQELDSDNPYAGDTDDPPMVAEMGKSKPKKGGALSKPKATVSKTYVPAGPSKGDLLGDAAEEIDPRIAELLGLQDGFDLSYDDYLTILKEWQVAARLKNSAISTEDSMLIDEERKRVKRKTGKFKVNVKKVNKPTTKTAVKPVKGALRGGQNQAQLQIAPGKDPKKKRKASLEENVAAIKKSVEKIFKVLEGQFKAIQKQSDKDRRNKQKNKRSKKEGDLEGIRKGMMNQARKLAAPTFDLLDRIFKFIGTVLLGRVMIKLLDWLADPENKDKVVALGKFLQDWWPVLLSAFVLFATPLGTLIRSVLAGVVKLSLFMAKKAIPALAAFAAKNPLAAAAIGTVAVVGGGAFLASQMNDSERDEANAKDDKSTVTPAETKATGQMPSGSQLMGEQTRQRGFNAFSGGGKIPKRTMPSGGKVTSSTGKRVSGAGKDTQMIVAQPGEIVMSKPAVDKFGAPFLLNLNKMGGGTNKPTFSKFGDLQFAQGGGVVGPQDFDTEKVMQTLRDCYITPTEFGPPGPNNPRIENVTNWLYGTGEKLNTEGLDEFQIMDLKSAKRSYPKIDLNRRRKNPLGANPEQKKEEEKKKAKAKPRPMGRSAAKKRMEAKNGEESAMEPPSSGNKVSSAAASAPINGVIPKASDAPKPAATTKPAPAMLGKGNLPPTPEPPQPKVNVVSASTTSGAGGPKSPPGSTGARDLPTDFEAFYQTEMRMMMLAIYGITEVE